ncbi:MAG: sulfotransferase domain-containing protein [Casimicrobiaceae bacterium]
MSWLIAVGLAALLVLAALGYVGGYFAWEARRTRGTAYFGAPVAERRAIKRQIARLSLPALPVVRLLSWLRRGHAAMPTFRFRDVAGPPNICSPATFEAASRYEPGAGDVFIATQMRSGTTWMQQIVYQIVTRGTGALDDARFSHLYMMSPWIETEDGVGVSEAPRFGEPPLRIIKTHLPAALCPYAARAKYICVARNPLSCFASIVDLDRMLAGPLLPSVESMAEWFCSDAMHWGSWPNHVRGWWDLAATHENVLFVHFEEMTRDFGVVRDRVAQFLGIALSPDEARRVDARCSFEFMTLHEEFFEMARPTMFSVRGGRFLRTGQANRDAGLPEPVRARIRAFCWQGLRSGSYPIARFYPDLADSTMESQAS